MTAPRIGCYYWSEEHFFKNLGDLLAIPILEALGYNYAPYGIRHSAVVNPRRCLLSTGSLLVSWILRISQSFDMWGSGWKGEAFTLTENADVRFYAVRGPLTAQRFGLAPTIPLGDPALLLPHLVTLSMTPHGRTVVVPHILRTTAMPARQRLSMSGCDELIPTIIRHPTWRSEWFKLRPREAIGYWRRVRFGITTPTLWQAVQCIAGAEFVLTGSLHGAILAQAYGVPWAAYDDGYVDRPTKWYDWAAYLGIRIEFVNSLQQGRQWWRQHGRHGRLRSLKLLLNAFPYPIVNPAARQIAATLSE